MTNEKDTTDIRKGLLTSSCKDYSLYQQIELL